jgi:hypothetical protein
MQGQPDAGPDSRWPMENACPDRFGGCRHLSFASLRVRLARAGSLAIGERRQRLDAAIGSL